MESRKIEGLKEEDLKEEGLKEEGLKVDKIRIDNALIDHMSILAQLELSREEREQAGEDLRKMLGYIDQLQELDTREAEEAFYGITAAGETDGPEDEVSDWNRNVFREDLADNGDGREDALLNAPSVRNGMFQVPKTVGGESV